MRRFLLVAEMTARELLRRRAMIGLLLLVPLAFYAASEDRVGRSVRFAALGTAWAVSTVALFAGLGARAIDRRLRTGGYRRAELIGGRAAAVAAIGVALAGAYLGLVVVHRQPDRVGALALMFVSAALVATVFGQLCAVVVPRELEGALLLMTVVGMQFIMDPAKSVAKLLPFWSTREFATYAIDHTAAGDLRQAALHAIGYGVACSVVLAVISARRLRGHHQRVATHLAGGTGGAAA